MKDILIIGLNITEIVLWGFIAVMAYRNLKMKK